MIDSVQVGEYEIISFHHYVIDGMVGEDVNIREAKLINFEDNSIKDLTYEDLKVYYRAIETKQERIEFFYLMKPFSPKEMDKELEEEIQDAIRRVI
jgi:hypothetical protein